VFPSNKKNSLGHPLYETVFVKRNLKRLLHRPQFDLYGNVNPCNGVKAAYFINRGARPVNSPTLVATYSNNLYINQNGPRMQNITIATVSIGSESIDSLLSGEG